MHWSRSRCGYGRHGLRRAKRLLVAFQKRADVGGQRIRRLGGAIAGDLVQRPHHRHQLVELVARRIHIGDPRNQPIHMPDAPVQQPVGVVVL
jgi:hypothetical protein